MRLQWLVLAAVLIGTSHAGSSTYKNERWGYKLRVPDGWTHAAMSAKEEWIASKHLGKRALTAKKSEFLMSDTPEIWVIGFPHARKEDRGARIKETGENTFEIKINNPYKDYKDFIKRHRGFMGGGYHFSEEKETEIRGYKVTQYELKVEKMVAAPSRILTWVYHSEDVDFAIQCRVIEDYFDKFKSDYLRCLKSFRRIPRTKAMPGSGRTGASVIKVEDESKMTPAERAKYRQDNFERRLKQEVAALPKDWYVERSKHYVALSNADRKFTKRTLTHAEAVRKYLDKSFGKIGSDYVPPGMIRIFATRAEETAYQESSTFSWFEDVQPVLVTETVGTDKSWEFEYVSRRLTSQWLGFKNKHLADSMPYWFSYGFEGFMAFARSKGTRVEIKPDPHDRQYIKDIIKQDKAIPIKELFSKGDDNEGVYGYQIASVVEYLMTDGSRGKTKKVIQRYLANLITAIEDAEKEYQAEKEKLDEERKASIESSGPVEETEDEESEEEEDGDKHWEKMREAMKKKAKAIRERAFELTFGELSDKDWARLDRMWRDYAG